MTFYKATLLILEIWGEKTEKEYGCTLQIFEILS